jgi:hypothetical protein
LSLSESLGLLTFSLTGESYWENEEQLRLFNDLRRIRDGLTHSTPQPLEISFTENFEIIEKLSNPNLLVNTKPIAKFSALPVWFVYSDAEQAIEILLHNLNRIQDIFLKGGFPSWFAIYDKEHNSMITTRKLIKTIKCRFSKYYSYDGL